MINGRGIKVTEPIREKVTKMVNKHNKLLTKANKIQVELKKGLAHSGVDNDLKVEITIFMPRSTVIRVEEAGSDFYAIIDLIDPVLKRRLVRYLDALKKWEGEESWRVVEEDKFQEELTDIEEDTYADSIDVAPRISRYKQYSQNSPMHPAEAIERMELLGHEAFMFKNIDNEGKYSMVYKRADGTYGLVEPKQG
ncbi:MAG: ribosome-associated translation inhibitor RaiA [Candidatus Dojkabacteria bacterium]|nr:ribosome-associated translation inhibitor RaiA [Candidatus Dojkabacteria bacterium]